MAGEGRKRGIMDALHKKWGQPWPSRHPARHPEPPGMDKRRKTRKTGATAEPNSTCHGGKEPMDASSGETQVGTVKVTIAVGDPQGQMFEDLEVTVDTGSTFTAVPGELLRRLGVPVLRLAQSELADGSNAPVEIGRTVIRLEGQQFPTPVIFAEEGEPSLLGVVTLEEALLAVDPVAGRLIPTNVLRL